MVSARASRASGLRYHRRRHPPRSNRLQLKLLKNLLDFSIQTGILIENGGGCDGSRSHSNNSLAIYAHEYERNRCPCLNKST